MTPRVAITGEHALLASALSSRLVADGARPTTATPDLLVLDAVRTFMREEHPDLVVHAAVRPRGIGAREASPASDLHQSLVAGANLIRAAAEQRIRKLVLVGSISAYPEFAPLPFRERDLASGPADPSSASDAAAFRALVALAQAARAEHGLDAVVVVPATLYGPGDNFDSARGQVVPALVARIIAARDAGESRVTLWGDGTRTRELLFSEDAADAILLAAERWQSPEPLNLGSGWEIPIADLATKIAAKVGFPGRFEWDRTRPAGPPRRRLDLSSATEIGIRAATTLDTGLDRTIAWYEAMRPR